MIIFSNLITPSALPRWRYNRAIRMLEAQGVYVCERDESVVQIETDDDSVPPLDVINQVERETGVKLALSFTS